MWGALEYGVCTAVTCHYQRIAHSFTTVSCLSAVRSDSVTRDSRTHTIFKGAPHPSSSTLNAGRAVVLVALAEALAGGVESGVLGWYAPHAFGFGRFGALSGLVFLAASCT